MSQLSRRTSHSLCLPIGDVARLTMYCGKNQLHKTSSLRSSSASIVNTAVLHSSCQYRQPFTFRINRLKDSCYPGFDSRIAFLQLPQFGLFQLGGIHCNCLRFFQASTMWWNLNCSEQPCCGQFIHASSRNHVCHHSTDLPEP